MSRSQNVHTPEEVERIRIAAGITAQVRDQIAAAARPGMTTFDLDQVAGELIRATGGKSAFKGYGGYPGNICISLNDEVVHGIGRPDRIILESDIVSIDVGVAINGALGDTALTFGFGTLPEDVARLLRGTKQSLMEGIAAARRGNRIGNVSRAVERCAKRFHLGVVRDYVGHGCGIQLHEPPEVPNFAAYGEGPILVPGMVICIEPMLTLGSWEVKVNRHDGWTATTRDGSWSAHFEHMVLITENEPEILTWQKTM